MTLCHTTVRWPRTISSPSTYDAASNKTIITALHQGSWPVIEGNLSWNADGSPKGSVVLTQWQTGKLLPVYPPGQALAAPKSPKPNWGTK